MTMKRTPLTEPSPAEFSAPDFILKLPSLTTLRALNAEKRANGDIQEDSDDDPTIYERNMNMGTTGRTGVW